MNDKAVSETPKHGITTVVSPPQMRDVFRLLFSKDNSLVQLYPKAVLVSLEDLDQLNKTIVEKLSHYEICETTFDAVASFESNRSSEFGTWANFCGADWHTPDVIDQLVLNWRFFIKLPAMTKPHSCMLSVRLANSLRPQHLVQALFSKNPDDVDRLELDMVPMSCRIDFVDNILSQELMQIVTNWNNGRRKPEYVFPFLRRVKKHSDKLQAVIRYSIPIFAISACLAWYYDNVSHLSPSDPASTGLITKTVMWLVGTGIALWISSLTGRWLAQYTAKHFSRFGRFTTFEITNGDSNRQDELMTKSRNSLWKLSGTAMATMIWDVLLAILSARYIK